MILHATYVSFVLKNFIHFGHTIWLTGFKKTVVPNGTTTLIQFNA